MTVTSAFKTIGNNAIVKIVIPAAAALMLSTGVASAKCYVDKAGAGGYSSREFSGNSAKTIWDRYCKPYIQRRVASQNIRNGKFGMRCHGSISCSISGRLVNGRLVLDVLDFGRGNTTRTPRRNTVKSGIVFEGRVVPPTREVRRERHSIYSDPGWKAFDDAVAACEDKKRGRRTRTTATRLTAPAC